VQLLFHWLPSPQIYTVVSATTSSIAHSVVRELASEHSRLSYIFICYGQVRLTSITASVPSPSIYFNYTGESLPRLPQFPLSSILLVFNYIKNYPIILICYGCTVNMSYGTYSFSSSTFHTPREEIANCPIRLSFIRPPNR